jgi:Ca2+-binding RTX toxin-like protein
VLEVEAQNQDHFIGRPRGTNGDDVICGLGGNDRLYGRGGDDVLIGGDGADRLYGQAGNDQLQGGTGPDVLDGGTGADLFDGGPGVDRARYSTRTAAVTVSIGNVPGADDGEAGERDNVTSTVENVYGGSGDDTLTGDAGRNYLYGDAGADTLRGLGGRDHLVGAPGNDLLDGGIINIGERDALTCSAGTDTYVNDPIDVLDGCENPAP